MIIRHLLLASLSLLFLAHGVNAQTAQPAGSAPAADTPSIRVGAVLFTDWTIQISPRTVDADGNAIRPNAFNVTRSYINLTGQLSPRLLFRLTPDIVRATDATASASNGSLVFRVKYAFAQFNLDQWMHGSFVRLGIQQTPWLDFDEHLYRYRFQGTMFAEREGYLTSADAGASFRYELPDGYGDLHAGVYNGEGYARAETNDRKAVMVRGSLRPLPASASPLARGLRASLFYDADSYVRSAERRRFLAAVTLEHRRVNAAFEYLRSQDRRSATQPSLSVDVRGEGFSVWATPRAPKGWEGLLRYDHLRPDAAAPTETRSRAILGLAYWLPLEGGVSSAVMLDYDGQTFHDSAPAVPKQSRVALHALISF